MPASGLHWPYSRDSTTATALPKSKEVLRPWMETTLPRPVQLSRAADKHRCISPTALKRSSAAALELGCVARFPPTVTSRWTCTPLHASALHRRRLVEPKRSCDGYVKTTPVGLAIWTLSRWQEHFNIFRNNYHDFY